MNIYVIEKYEDGSAELQTYTLEELLVQTEDILYHQEQTWHEVLQIPFIKNDIDLDPEYDDGWYQWEPSDMEKLNVVYDLWNRHLEYEYEFYQSEIIARKRLEEFSK